MSKKNPRQYIIQSDNKITKPAECQVSGDEIELSNGSLVYLTEEYRPLCETYKDRAFHIASVQHAGGYLNNGINPETGETQALDSTSWWNLQDVKNL